MHKGGDYRDITDVFNTMRETQGDFHLHPKVEERAATLGRPNLITIMLVALPGLSFM